MIDERNGVDRLSPSNYTGKQNGDGNDPKKIEDGVTKVKIITETVFINLLKSDKNKNSKHYDVSFV